jgi:DNA-binding MarR family transcriptional regulator
MTPDRLRNFGFLLHDIVRLYKRHFERHARELDVSMAECKVLAHLSRNEGISQARLAELTETEPMTLVRVLDRMQQQQWVERRPDPADRRAHRLYLLEASRPVVARMWKLAERARNEALAAIDGSDREQLLNLLERVHARLLELDMNKEPA